MITRSRLSPYGHTDGEPRRLSVAFLLATIVTLAAAIPLAILAFDARGDNPAPDTGLLISAAGTTTALSGAVVPEGSDASLSIDEAELVAASWVLYDADEHVLGSGMSVGAAPYPVDLSPLTIADLQPGVYELLVSGTRPDGDVVERAARFAIGDSP